MVSIKTLLFAALGLLSAPLIGYIMDLLPAKSFCDYEETPDSRHLPPRVSRGQKVICAIVLAVVFSALQLRFGAGLQSVALCVFSAALLMAALSDIRFCIIPDETIIIGCVSSVAAAMPHILTNQRLPDKLSPVIGAAIAAIVMLMIQLLGRLLYGKDGLGMGDVKLMVVCGIACGSGGTLIALVIGILAAALWFGVALACKRIRAGTYMPLGPFLVFGTLATLCFRPQIDALLAWYVSLI